MRQVAITSRKMVDLLVEVVGDIRGRSTIAFLPYMYMRNCIELIDILDVDRRREKEMEILDVSRSCSHGQNPGQQAN